MGEPTKGTNNNDSLENMNDWCLLEADCVDSMDTLSDLFETETNVSSISNLIDDLEPVTQGNSLALFNSQVREECDKDLLDLKRKFLASPERSVNELSPRLEAVHISPQRLSKRRLFENTEISNDETSNSVEQVPNVDSGVHTQQGATHEEWVILHSSNVKATLLTKFKDKYHVSFNEITRNFKSSKTCTHNWVLAAFGIAEDLLEASKTLLKPHCDYIQMIMSDFSGLFVLEFKNTKNRETVLKLFTGILNAKPEQILCEPPRVRSVSTALFFYKKVINNIGFKFGEYPEWISSQIITNHQLASAESFKLSEMIQWAYDNDYTDEASIAFFYAIYAQENANAAAFLQSNQQRKYVKDTCAMVKLYKKQEQKNMSMSQWIFKCCGDEGDTDEWKIILKLLKFQNINILSFLIAMKQFFKCIPKKMCIVIYGPPDTGKSFFCFKLVKFLQGNVVSYMNKSSHFWLMPLTECKIGFLDDATSACWNFLDVNMRNAFDGNSVSVDIKHKALQQIRLPPMLITTNVPVPKEPSLMFLQSRLTCFEFPNKLPFDESGNPVFNITNSAWASFFKKFSRQLELSEEATNGDKGIFGNTFCCTAGDSVESN